MFRLRTEKYQLKEVISMLANNNEAIINKLAKNSVKTNKKQYAILFFTIILSAFMLFCVFTIGITELNRGILAELIDTIYIHENNEITIKFNFADQHKRLLDFISNNQNTSKKEGRVYTLPSLSKSTLAV